MNNPKNTHNLDQDWAKARNFVATTPLEIIARLMDDLTDDSPNNLIYWMRSNPKIADVVQRLALLAMRQVAHNIGESKP